MDDLSQFPSIQLFGEQLAARTARDVRRWRPPLLRLAAACCAVVLVSGGMYAVPATRAAVDDAFGSFSGWISGDDQAAPGKPVSATDRVPTCVSSADGEPRVLAQADGEKLIASRHGSTLVLALNNYCLAGTLNDLSQTTAAVVLVGPGDFVANGRYDRRPVFGLASASIHSVRFDYADGGGTSVPAANGAFGVSIETNRRPASITAFDSAGTIIARLPLTVDEFGHGFRYCPGTPQGCSPWQK